MFTEDELLPISALQHLVFCERQWALIHLEQQWTENYLTASGRILHEKAHEADREVRGDTVICRGLPLRSVELGLVGKADVVEFLAVSDTETELGVSLDGCEGLWRPVPVEYKHGKPKIDRSDEIQLCAQALCLEEMLGVSINEGVLYYGRPHRRSTVALDMKLRSQTIATISRLHQMTREGVTPPAQYSKRCRACSLSEECMPQSAGAGKSAVRYLRQIIQQMETGDDALP